MAINMGREDTLVLGQPPPARGMGGGGGGGGGSYVDPWAGTIPEVTQGDVNPNIAGTPARNVIPAGGSYTPPPNPGANPNPLPTPAGPGYPGGYDARISQLQGYLNPLSSRPAPQAGGVTLGPAAQAADSPFRGDQQGALGMFRDWAMGKDSVAAQAGANATNRAMAMQRSMAAGARPGMGAMAARQAMLNSGKAATDIGAATQQAQIQERQAAAGALGNLATAGRGQDQQLGMFNADQSNVHSRFGAGLEQQRNLANMESELRTMGMNDQQIATILGLQHNAAALQQRGDLAGGQWQHERAMFGDNAALQTYLQAQGIQAGKDMQEAAEPAWWEKALGAGMGIAGLALPFLGRSGGGGGGSPSGYTDPYGHIWNNSLPSASQFTW